MPHRRELIEMCFHELVIRQEHIARPRSSGDMSQFLIHARNQYVDTEPFAQAREFRHESPVRCVWNDMPAIVGHAWRLRASVCIGKMHDVAVSQETGQRFCSCASTAREQKRLHSLDPSFRILSAATTNGRA